MANITTTYLLIACLATLKLLYVTSIRMFYPYAPFFAAQLSLTTTDYFIAVSIQEVSGAFSILLSPLFERLGSETVILAAILVNASSLLIFASFPSYVCLVLTRFASGFVGTMLETAVQQLVGERIDEKSLGKATGVIEMSWGLSTLLGIPVIGVLIEKWSWHAPLYVIAGLIVPAACISGFIFFRVHHQKTTTLEMPIVIASEKDIVNPLWSNKKPVIQGHRFSSLNIMIDQKALEKGPKRTDKNPQAVPFCTKIMLIFCHGTVLLTFLQIFFHSAAMNIIYSNYGQWLVNDFNFDSTSLGLFSFFVGAGEMSSDIIVTLIADKFSFESSILVSSILCTVFFGIEAVLAYYGQLYAGGIVLFFIFLSTETSTVISISRAPLVCPAAGHIFMSCFFASVVLGLFTGAFVSSYILSFGYGFTSSCIVSALCSLVPVLAMSAVILIPKWKLYRNEEQVL